MKYSTCTDSKFVAQVATVQYLCNPYSVVVKKARNFCSSILENGTTLR